MWRPRTRSPRPRPPTTKRIELPTVTPQALAKTFGDPTYVATDVPYRTQAEVDEAAKALADEMASAFAEFEGTARGNPKLRAGASVSIDGLGEPFDGKYTITTSRHRFDPMTGYSTSFSVTGRRDRTMLGLASGGARQGAGRHRDRAGQRRGRPGEGGAGQAHLSVAVGGLRQRLGPYRAARSGQGPRLAGAARGRRRGAGRVRAGGFPAGRRCSVASSTGWTPCRSGPVDLVDGGTGRINRRSMVSRLGHRVDLVDASGKEGVRVATTDEKLKLIMDHTGTTITLHADGKV